MITFLKGSYNKGNLKFLRDCIDVPCQEYDIFPLYRQVCKMQEQASMHGHYAVTVLFN